ncbi:MAG: type II toxin-antitoxin system VapC family toxin [Actinobacteria bacterium]|nr:type II toxin-antitoxin system VapC family toxin [Actinomycetota bacterium]
MRMTDASVVDTSVVVGALVHGDPDTKARCRESIEASPGAIAHVLAESYASLTALPGNLRLAPPVARRVLNEMFPQPPMTLSAQGYLHALDLMSGAGIPGGAIYDCLIAETARENRAHIVSLDARAARTYAVVGVEFTLL